MGASTEHDREGARRNNRRNSSAISRFFLRTEGASVPAYAPATEYLVFLRALTHRNILVGITGSNVSHCGRRIIAAKILKTSLTQSPFELLLIREHR
jgi:hypothetical protein